MLFPMASATSCHISLSGDSLAIWRDLALSLTAPLPLFLPPPPSFSQNPPPRSQAEGLILACPGPTLLCVGGGWKETQDRQSWGSSKEEM